MSNLVEKNLFSKNENNHILDNIQSLFLLLKNKNKKNPRALASYSQLIRIAFKDNGFTILDHFFTHGSGTITELVESYGLQWGTADRIVKLFVNGGIVRLVGFVGPRYSKSNGKRVKVYLLHAADTKCGPEAQVRYAEIIRSKRGDTMRQVTMVECLNAVKLHLDERNQNRIPPIHYMRDILKEQDLVCTNYPLLLSDLRKEGYKL